MRHAFSDWWHCLTIGCVAIRIPVVYDLVQDIASRDVVGKDNFQFQEAAFRIHWPQ